MKILLDVHTHTVASGHAFSTLQEMVRTAADKGLQILGITEHTGGIPGTCSPIYFRNLPVVPRLMYGDSRHPLALLQTGNGRAEYIGCGRCYT